MSVLHVYHRVKLNSLTSISSIRVSKVVDSLNWGENVTAYRGDCHGDGEIDMHIDFDEWSLYGDNRYSY